MSNTLQPYIYRHFAIKRQPARKTIFRIYIPENDLNSYYKLTHNPDSAQSDRDFMKDIIKIIDSILDKETYEYGFADLEGLLHEEFSAFPFGISVARKLDNAIINSISAGPTEEYLDHYHSVNSEINRNISLLRDALASIRIKALPVMSTVSADEFTPEYLRSLKYKHSHKMTATRSGLGWIGKTDLFVSFKFGPRVRLGTVLIDYPLRSTRSPVQSSFCGACSLCVDECPAKAASGREWNYMLDRDEFFNAKTCMNYCQKISAEKLKKHISMCGKCVQVCPRGTE